MDTKQKIRKYVLDNYLFTDDESALGDDDSFLEKGIIDSTGILEIIYFLEDEFGISMSDEEMTPENLDSVSRIAEFVERKSDDIVKAS
ncbi:MAG TPA: acyl carrier protein [Gammaproteobacteria bacterium]|nr:acyl carrier protein [Gammaproteobacteria bacterium]